LPTYKSKLYPFIQFFCTFLLVLTASADTKVIPQIQLATLYKKPINIKEYWVSEKLDGIRGYWDGTTLKTRSGNMINTPQWFTKNWPKVHLDGELWSQRGQFEKISSCVRKNVPNQVESISCWKNIRFMTFDLPQHSGTFTQRITAMKRLKNKTNNDYFSMIKQTRITSVSLLNQQLTAIVTHNGEGLMLHHQAAFYKEGRSDALMKLKQYNDAEAVVIAYVAGKGKYKNKMGSLKVKMPSGLTFKVGTGFTDSQRENPPPIGSTITYKYIGKTTRGVPRFASFLRVRQLSPSPVNAQKIHLELPNTKREKNK
jgi:DNA ligase-1